METHGADWTNKHQLTGSVGGPIVKNKTFFFALFDDQLVRARTTQNPIVLTPCARNGIFRYFDSWNNGNAIAPTQATGTTPTIAVVDGIGNPRPPATNPNGTPFTGALRYASVFGQLPEHSHEAGLFGRRRSIRHELGPIPQSGRSDRIRHEVAGQNADAEQLRGRRRPQYGRISLVPQ